jgi:hypothetical protein
MQSDHSNSLGLRNSSLPALVNGELIFSLLPGSHSSKAPYSVYGHSIVRLSSTGGCETAITFTEPAWFRLLDDYRSQLPRYRYDIDTNHSRPPLAKDGCCLMSCSLIPLPFSLVLQS